MAVVEWRCDVRATAQESRFDDGRSFGVLNVYFVDAIDTKSTAPSAVTQRDGLKVAAGS